MTSQTCPTALELRSYALGHLDRATASRIERYLLISGDTCALRLVTAFARARLRVEALNSQKNAVSWFAATLERLGTHVREMLQSVDQTGLELLSQPLIGATLGPKGELQPGSRVRFRYDRAERYLHVLAADREGQWSILYPDSGSQPKTHHTTPELPLPPEAAVAVGIASPRPLFRSAEGSIHLTRLERALERVGLTHQDVALSCLEIEDPE